MIQLEAIHKSFGDTHVLRGVSLSIDRGEVVCIIGPSGSGKVDPATLYQLPGTTRSWTDHRSTGRTHIET